MQNQVIKCPITSLPIQNPFKHKCGHSYEMDAILNYCKARNVLKRYKNMFIIFELEF